MLPRTPPASAFAGPPRDFRELADPEVLHDNGKWYLYASCGDLYVSEDFINWKFEKLTFAGNEKLGYAPTITKCGNTYLLSSSRPFADGKPEILAAGTGPVQDRIFQRKRSRPAAVVDLAANTRELITDFRTIAPCHARYAKITLLPPTRPNLRREINNITFFGNR